MAQLHDHVRGPEPPVPDTVTFSGAMRLKMKIEDYWKGRGHKVTVTLHEVGFHPAIRSKRFELRSNMVNGWPPPGSRMH